MAARPPTARSAREVTASARCRCRAAPPPRAGRCGAAPHVGTCGSEPRADLGVEPPVVAVAVIPPFSRVFEAVCKSELPLQGTSRGARWEPAAPGPRPPVPPAVPPRAPRGATPPGTCRRRGTAARPARGTRRPAARRGTRCRWAACRSPIPPSCGRTGAVGAALSPRRPDCSRRAHLPRSVLPQKRLPVTSMAALRGAVAMATPPPGESRGHATPRPSPRRRMRILPLRAAAHARWRAGAEGSSRRAAPPCPAPCRCPPWRSSTCRRWVRGRSRALRALLGRPLLLPLCLAAGNGQLGRAEGRGPPLRLAVRPAQQGVHAVPLGGEGPAEVPAGGPPGQPVRARLLQVSGWDGGLTALLKPSWAVGDRGSATERGHSPRGKRCAFVLSVYLKLTLSFHALLQSAVLLKDMLWNLGKKLKFHVVTCFMCTLKTLAASELTFCDKSTGGRTCQCQCCVLWLPAEQLTPLAQSISSCSGQ